MADYLTKEELNALLAERDKKTEETIVGTLKGFTEQFGAKIDQTINGAIGRLEKESNSRFEGITSKLAIVDEIKSALEAPDDDVPTTQQQQQQQASPPDFDALIQEQVKKLDKQYNTKLSEATNQIKALQDAVDAERQEKLALTQKQIAEARRNGFINTAKKIAPEIGLFNDIEEALLLKLQADGVLKESEDGNSYLLETVQRDKYTGQEQTVLAPIDAALPELLKNKYTQFLVPRGGVGANATPTQTYVRPTRNMDNLQPSDFAEGVADASFLDDIAAAISASN